MPISSAISRMVNSWRRRRTIWATSTTIRGRPSFVPFAILFRRPALTRSAIIVNTIFPVGVEVSICFLSGGKTSGGVKSGIDQADDLFFFYNSTFHQGPGFPPELSFNFEPVYNLRRSGFTRPASIDQAGGQR